MTHGPGLKLLALVTLGGAVANCSGDGQVDIGHDVAQLSDYGASWDGYAEAASFPVAGSDRLRLVLDGNGQGTLRLGDAALMPPPTRAEGGYPVDDPSNTGAGGGPASFRDGFAYPVHDAQVEAGRIRFGIDPKDLYAGWCALVPPVVNEELPSGFGCGTSGGSESYTDGTCFYQEQDAALTLVPVDCGIYHLCVGPGVCTCTASACGAHVTPTPGGSLDNYPIVVDAAIDADGTTLTGTLAIKSGDPSKNRITIRMQR